MGLPQSEGRVPAGPPGISTCSRPQNTAFVMETAKELQEYEKPYARMLKLPVVSKGWAVLELGMPPRHYACIPSCSIGVAVRRILSHQCSTIPTIESAPPIECSP